MNKVVKALFKVLVKTGEECPSLDLLRFTRDVMVESLSPTHAKIYFMVDDMGPITSQEIASVTPWSISHVSFALYELFKYGLILRRVKSNDNGTHFEYMTNNFA